MFVNSDVASTPALWRRKRSYRTGPLDGDFFVVKHLGRFVRSAIAKHVTAGMRVADVGCGEQPWRGAIEERGAQYVGIDITQNAQDTVEIIGPITQVPAPDAAFHAILCTEVLEHVSDTRAALAELRRLCTPGGVIILTTPFVYPIHEEPFDFVRVTPDQLRALAHEAGLVATRLETAGNEIEALAVIWNSMWSRGLPRRLGVLRLLLLAITRLPANGLASLVSSILGHVLPRKAFLSVLAVLHRPE